MSDNIPDRLPAGLDARAVIRFIIHCSHCGEPHTEPEFNSVTTWGAEDLAKLSDFLDVDSGWELDLDGRFLACPRCAQIGWCESCGGQIRAWQRYREIPATSEGSFSELIHADCELLPEDPR